MSNASRIPVIGGLLFLILERLTKILDFYPKRNLSESNFGLRYLESLVQKGWGRVALIWRTVGKGSKPERKPTKNTMLFRIFGTEKWPLNKMWNGLKRTRFLEWNDIFGLYPWNNVRNVRNVRNARGQPTFLTFLTFFGRCIYVGAIAFKYLL